MNKAKIFLPIFNSPKEIVLLDFKEVNNSDYFLLDTGSVLKLLPRLNSFIHRLDKGTLKLAFPEKTIEQVTEHLVKSFDEKKRDHLSTHGVEEGMRNLVKLLNDRRILKIANPERKLIESNTEYEEFEEDRTLAYVLFEGKFKGIVTEDGELKNKISRSKLVLSYKDLLTN